MAPFRDRVVLVLAKVETTSGVDAAPTTTANAIKTVGIPVLKYNYLASGSRDDVQVGVLGSIERATPAGRNGSVEITMEITGAGAAYSDTVRPPSDPFLRASGFSATVVSTSGSESVTYTTIDDGMETMTLWLYTMSNVYKLVGGVCQPKLMADVNGIGHIQFTVTGKISVDPVAAAFPASWTTNQTTPPTFQSQSAITAIGTWTPASAEPLMLRHAEVDFGTTIVDRASAGAPDGLVSYVITDRKARLNMVVEAVSLATFDPYAMSKAPLASLPTVAFAVGTQQYQRCKVYGGKWAIEAPEQQSASGMITWSLNGNLVQQTEVTSGREIRVVYD